MRPGVRSLNLSNAVAVAVYEAWRQAGFAGAGLSGLASSHGSTPGAARAVSGSPRAARAAAGSSTACRGGSPSCSTRYTASQIGMSTPWCRASARTAAAAPTPSATWPSSARIAGSGLPCASAEADAAIARQVAGAGQHEVAQPGEPHQRLALPAERRRQAPGFGQPAGDERGAGVVAEPQAVARAGGDRQHVLDRAADLDAGNVVALVHAQRVGAQQRGDIARRARAPSPPRRRPSAARARPPPRSSDPISRRPAPASAVPAPGAQARRPPAAPRRRDDQEPFRQPDERRARAAAAERQRRRGQRRHRRADDEQIGAGRCGQVAGDRQRVRQRDSGQVSR